MTTPEPTTDREAASAFIITQQAAPETATAYLSTRAERLEADLDDLDQPWTQTLRVIRHRDGTLTGAVVVEWDPEVGMAWVHGPWTTPATWEHHAEPLLAAAIDQAPVERHQMYAPAQNTRLADLAERIGWRAGPTHIVYSAARAGQALADPQVRPVTEDDLPALTALHESAFPGTYATVRQLIAPNSDYTTLVLTDDSGLIGYIAGRPDDEDLYLDFLAVDPSRRRTGAATRLIGALAHALPGQDITLTCDETQTAAVGLYEALGWRQTSETRSYEADGALRADADAALRPRLCPRT